MKRKLIIAFLAFSMVACQSNVKEIEHTEAGDSLSIPIDTTKAIADLHLNESVSRLDLIRRDCKKGLKNLDTIELLYMEFACDCQQWVDRNEYNRWHYLTERKGQDSKQIVFDLDKYGYYIEPADKDLEIIWNAFMAGNIVKFIGKEYNKIGYPDNAKFMDSNPPKGKVFRYYSYEIQRPFRVWGPETFAGIDGITGDSMRCCRTLTVN